MVTDDDDLADRLRLIRNHAEVVVEDKGVTNLSNMIGFNFRLGEVECAIGIEQLKKLQRMTESRQHIARRMDEGLGNLRGLRTPAVRPGCTHVYYTYCMTLDPVVIGVSRDVVHRALTAEGIPALGARYENLHLLPMYQKKMAYGSKGFPWTSDICRRDVSYAKGICPAAERMNDEQILSFGICMHTFEDDEVDAIIGAFHKVWRNLDVLR
jgi:perosamine synthetase